MKVVIGIDPGTTGAIAVLDGANTVYDMPIGIEDYTGLKKVLLYDVIDILERHNPDIIIVEKQAVTRVTGRVSAMKLGMNYQVLIDAIRQYNRKPTPAAVEIVSPVQWKRHLGLLTRKGVSLKEKKMKTRKKMEGMYPNINLCGPKGGYRDGRGDAVAIAEYGRSKHV